MSLRAPGMRLALALASIALAALGAYEQGARAGGVDPPRPPAGAAARFFLSWKAPWGGAAAREDLSEPCLERAVFDTLYLCFDPVRDTSRIVGMTATMRFWPAPGETLASHWRLEQGEKYRGLRADFDPDSVPGTLRPWSVAGAGGLRYRSLATGGQARLVYAVPTTGAAEVYGGRIYVFARLLVPRPPRGEGCDRPVCIEWEEGALAYGPRDEPVTHLGPRHVSWKSPGAAVCATYRRITGATPWSPPGVRKH